MALRPASEGVYIEAQPVVSSVYTIQPFRMFNEAEIMRTFLVLIGTVLIYDHWRWFTEQHATPPPPPPRQRQRGRTRKQRRCWVSDWLLNRCDQGDYEHLLQELNRENDDRRGFRNFLRMEPELFQELVERLTPYLEKKNTHCRRSLPVGLKVACTLRHLATGNSYASLSYSFRVSKAAICLFVPEVCQAIIKCYQPEVMKCPQTPEEWKQVAEGFSQKWHYHNCFGALDGKHVGMQKPQHGGSVFYNYKKFNSVILMALVDANYKFLYVDIGAEGGAGDASTWMRSSLHDAIDEKRAGLPPDTTLPNDDRPLPYHIIGDDAFALKTWLMKPYSHRSQVHHERIFSYRLSRARRVVENAFGILAAKFRIFGGNMLQNPHHVKIITMACCVLHNLLLERYPNVRNLADSEDSHNNLMPGAWREQTSAFTRIPQRGGQNFTRDAKNLRDYLAHYYTSEAGAVPWQERMINTRAQLN